MATFGVARKGDSILGQANGEHHGHQTCDEDSCWPTHPGSHTLTGNINGGSPNVFCNGIPVARLGEGTTEFDSCGNGSGSVAQGSSTVFVNGKPVARIQDAISPHHGWAKINTGSPNVFCG